MWSDNKSDIVEVTFTHSSSSVTKVLERGCTLSFSGVAQDERHQTGMGMTISPGKVTLYWSSH